MKRGFTLMEVNLAIAIMAVGVLAILGLYSLGYREGNQSREDVASAALADAVIGRLQYALSATNVTWKAFSQIEDSPNSMGWRAYLNSGSHVGLAQGAFKSVVSKVGASEVGWPGDCCGDLDCGLVIRHETPTVISISFRAAFKPEMLLSAPIYYTEVVFQGVSE